VKILLIVNMPWTRELGASRTYIEIAEDLRHRGHIVDKFDADDAALRHTRLSVFFQQARYCARAARFVRQHGRNYDVIQAESGNLPYFKRELNYEGVLVVRSNGLPHFHEQYARARAARVTEAARRRGRSGSIGGNVLRWLARQTWGLRQVERSFAAADAVVLLNEDERRFVAHRLGYAEKVYCLPNGLSEERFTQFAAQVVRPAARRAGQQIVFIGRWVDLKGAEDLPRIARAVRSVRPETRFLLMGTGVEREQVLTAFDPADRPAVVVVPAFLSDELPVLLREATIGVFPSYIEGFGLAVLEKLAAGIPTVAYDVPGPREMLKFFDHPPLMTPSGDVAAMAERLLTLLGQPEAEYARLSEQARAVAGRFRWSDVVDSLLEIYASVGRGRLLSGRSHKEVSTNHQDQTT